MKFEEIKEIWIEAEQWENGFSDENVNSDVIVTMENGVRWIATFFTICNVIDLMEKSYENSKEQYFWSSDMIIVPDFDREQVESVIKRMLIEEYFVLAFKECSNEE